MADKFGKAELFEQLEESCDIFTIYFTSSMAWFEEGYCS